MWGTSAQRLWCLYALVLSILCLSSYQVAQSADCQQKPCVALTKWREKDNGNYVCYRSGTADAPGPRFAFLNGCCETKEECTELPRRLAQGTVAVNLCTACGRRCTLATCPDNDKAQPADV